MDAGIPRSRTSVTIQSSRLDTKLSSPLLELPTSIIPAAAPAAQRSLPVRSLMRGLALGLPSGQAVAEHLRDVIREAPLGEDELWPGTQLRGKAPLWYYVLKEAEVRGGGRRLGPIGGRIVGEVILGLLGVREAGSKAAAGAVGPRSYLHASGARGWRPTFESRLERSSPDFDFLDLLHLAGVDIA